MLMVAEKSLSDQFFVRISWNGALAEELGKSLQNFLHECESRTRLQDFLLTFNLYLISKFYSHSSGEKKEIGSNYNPNRNDSETEIA